MKKVALIFILFAIISFSTALYFLISHFSPVTPITSPSQSVYLSPLPTPTVSQTTLCEPDQLVGVLSAQGAAGNMYAKLQLTNTGKTACDVELGNIVIATFDNKYIVPDNIVMHNVQSVPAYSYMLAPGEKVYSQVHFPNGPQCQSGVEPKQINFLVDQSTVIFKPDKQTGNLMIQSCHSAAEKTTVDIWPLSKTPVTP